MTASIALARRLARAGALAALHDAQVESICIATEASVETPKRVAPQRTEPPPPILSEPWKAEIDPFCSV